jgi:hypothetical protein
MDSVVAYLRVSTQRQQRSGLGIEAQRATVARFAEAEGFAIIAEYVEIETGKGADALDRGHSWRPPSKLPSWLNAASWSPSWTACRAMSRSCQA